MALSIAFKHDWHQQNPTADADGWRAYLHDELEWEVQHLCWMPLVCQVHQLTLKYLEVSVQNCYCPCGCDGQLAWAISWLCDWESEPPEVLVIVGTRSVEEREEISAVVKNPLRDETQPVLRFDKCLDVVGPTS